MHKIHFTIHWLQSPSKPPPPPLRKVTHLSLFSHLFIHCPCEWRGIYWDPVMCNRKRGGSEMWTQKTKRWIDRPIGVALNQYHAGGLLSWLSGRSHHLFFFFFLAHWSINYSTHPPYFQFQGKPPRVTLYFLYNKDAKGLIQLGIICHFMKYEYISILIKGNVNFFLVYCNCGDLGLRLKINTILSRIMARYNVRS